MKQHVARETGQTAWWSKLRQTLTNPNKLLAEAPPLAAELVKPHMCGQVAR